MFDLPEIRTENRCFQEGISGNCGPQCSALGDGDCPSDDPEFIAEMAVALAEQRGEVE